MTLEPAWSIILISGLICLTAATVTGFSGFGFALIAVPLLTLVLDLKFVVPLVLLMSLFSVVVLSANKLRFFREPTIVFIFIGTMAGLMVGTYSLANFDTSVLKKILGIVVALFALHIFLRARREREPERREGLGPATGIPVALFVGILSGLAGGLFGTSGPPLVIYVDYFAKDKSSFRAQLLVLFVLHDVFRLFLYIHFSLMNMEVVRFGLWLLPGVCVGLLVGSRMHYQVNEKTFSRAVAAMLLVSGLLLLKP